jgi:hypothetical protein
MQSFDALLGDADHVHTVTTSPALPFMASVATTSKNQEHIAALTGMLQKQQSHMRKIVTAVSQMDNQVKQRFASIKSPKNGCNKHTPEEDSPWMCDAPSNPCEVKELNNHSWYYFVTCGHWSTSHSINGFTHDGKEIAKHNGSSPGKRHNNQSPSQLSPTKKKKTPKSNVAGGLQSLQAELKSESSSPFFHLHPKLEHIL